VELNDIEDIDIQEMTLSGIETTLQDIEKTLAGNEKKISSNFAKIQKSIEELNKQTQVWMGENAKLASKLKELNQYKNQKLLEETKARMFAQIEQVKGLNVATLLAPPPKAKSPEAKISKKSAKVKNPKNANFGKNEKSAEAENSQNANFGKNEKSADTENFQNANFGKNEKSADTENSQNQNSENLENGKTAETENTTSAISDNADSEKTVEEKNQDSELMVLIAYLGLPEDASLAEVRQTFDANKNSLDAEIVDECEKIFQKFVRE